MLDDWAAYCVEHGHSFDVYRQGVSSVIEDPQYYADNGYGGLARSLEPQPEPFGPDRYEWHYETKQLVLKKKF